MPSSFPTSASGRRVERDLRREILDEFARRASVRGIRAVVMSELARDLGISTKTLYRHFPTKADLVDSLMQEWSSELERRQADRLDRMRDPVARVQEVAHESLELIGAFSTTFWTELRRDFPEPAARFTAAVVASYTRAGAWLAPMLREGVDLRVAGRLLHVMLAAAADPDTCDELGITRRDAVDQAVRLWAEGALRPRPHAVANPDPNEGAQNS
jgi:AcrR family transcriptional regulator